MPESTAAVPANPRCIAVLHIASEVAPFIKSGGLADVAQALPAALRRLGHDARVCLPCYKRVYLEADRRGVRWLPQPMIIESGGVDHRVGIGLVDLDGLPVYLLACNELYDRDGLYGPSQHQDYEDNARRFSVFSKAALALPGAIGWAPHIVHAHDWQAGLVPALLERGFNRALPATRSVFTIHNIAFQGSFPPHDMRLAGLDPWLYNPMHCEHFGRFNMLKTGIVFADRVTTVSRRYAEEIQTSEFGWTLDAVIRHHAYKLSGITNGIDPIAWNPATDPHLPARYDVQDLAGKRACKQALRSECGLAPYEGACLVGMVSRLTEQKGVDLVIDAVSPYILAGRMQLVVVGSGDLYLEHRLHALQQRHPGWVYVWYGYNEGLAHRCIAGSDLFLMPSRFEPCGLTQMYAMRYGTLPLVRYTGGLADTVVDVTTGAGNGFTFGPVDLGHFSSVLDRALGLYQYFPAEWAAAQRRGMTTDFSWDRAAQHYAELYRSITWP
ncbi:MAG: glycogen synthase GlgA [Planctomycetota bacterium]|nr:glycogen synthase GlgA [Planctomycetota bacterium]MDW8373172.1 glycogen synthase GlgA [Planctomycetota bacterium]